MPVEESPDLDYEALDTLWANVDAIPPSAEFWANWAEDLRKQEIVDNAEIDGLALSNFDPNQARDDKGRWEESSIKEHVRHHLTKHGPTMLGDIRHESGHKKVDKSNPLGNPIHKAVKEMVDSGEVEADNPRFGEPLIKLKGVALSNVAGEARDSSGEWTTGGAATVAAGKAQRKGAHATAVKQARQAYVGARMQHDAATAPGLVTQGNISLTNRPQIKNADGSVSTVRSMSVNIGGKEVLIPTVSAIQNRVLTDDEAIAEYQQTGQHLGVFNSPQAATQYANILHKHQEEFYK